MNSHLLEKSIGTLCVLILIMLFTSCNKYAIKPDLQGKYLKKIYESDGGELNYRIIYPKGFHPKQKYGVLLFLHGAGERGSDNEAQLIHGSELIAAGINKHQAIAIFPQCPKEDYWVKLLETENLSTGQRDFVPDVESPPSNAMQQVISLLSETLDRPYVDQSRVYITGLSMGGMGTFDLLWRMPNTFAAGMPICGAGSPEKASLIAKTPLRIFHGVDDSVVAAKESIDMIKAIKAQGGTVQSYLYPSVNHDSWTNAFAEPDFIDWLFTKQRK